MQIKDKERKNWTKVVRASVWSFSLRQSRLNNLNKPHVSSGFIVDENINLSYLNGKYLKLEFQIIYSQFWIEKNSAIWFNYKTKHIINVLDRRIEYMKYIVKLIKFLIHIVFLIHIKIKIFFSLSFSFQIRSVCFSQFFRK